MECILVSNTANTSRQISSAALTVEVGSFADPTEALGLAHFLEHMVFMGSSKYPGENEYDSFVSSHGGGCNAFTEGEYTTYQFDITTKHFSKALDIFANCFLTPLFNEGSVRREIVSASTSATSGASHCQGHLAGLTPAATPRSWADRSQSAATHNPQSRR